MSNKQGLVVLRNYEARDRDVLISLISEYQDATFYKRARNLHNARNEGFIAR